jgi:hypothetical protein
MDFMRRRAGEYFGPGAFRLWRGNGLESAAGTITDTTGESIILYNPETLGSWGEDYISEHGGDIHNFVLSVLTHEYIHATVNEMALTGMVDRSWYRGSEAVHDHITRPMGINRSCGVDSGGCSGSCGLGEAIALRFARCLEEVRAPDAGDLRCRYSPDYCDDRVHGGLTGFTLGMGCYGSPDVGVDSECLVVNCADSGALSSACCGAMSGGALPRGVFIRLPDPGPRPPPPALWASGLPWAHAPRP